MKLPSVSEVRKAVAALSAGWVAAAAAGVVTHHTDVLVAGWLSAAGVALAVWASKANEKKGP